MATPGSPRSPKKKEKLALLREHTKAIVDGIDAVAYFLKELSNRGSLIITVSDLGVLALVPAANKVGSKVTIAYRDIQSAQKELNKLVRTGTQKLFSRLNDRSGTNKINPLDNPKFASDEIKNFILGATPLTGLLPELALLQPVDPTTASISSQTVVNSSINAYVFDDASPNHPRSAFFSSSNIERIKAFMVANNTATAAGAASDPILAGFLQGLGPEGQSTANVWASLGRVGISAKTFAPDKDRVIKGTRLGADRYMLGALGNTFNSVFPQNDPVNNPKKSSANDFEFSDLQKLTAYNFSKNEADRETLKPFQGKVEKELYLKQVGPFGVAFRKAYNATKKLIQDNTIKRRDTLAQSVQISWMNNDVTKLSLRPAMENYKAAIDRLYDEQNISDGLKFRLASEKEGIAARVYYLKRKAEARGWRLQ